MSSPFALIVEDNPDIGYVYEEILRSIHFDTERVLDGKQALKRLKETVPDLIILDMNLPYVSGHYVLKEIRSDVRLAQVPVIIATANAVMAQALKPELTEYDMLLIKPVTANQLREVAVRLR